MRELYTGLIESKGSRRLDEAHVGVFYYIDGDVYADTSSLRGAEAYGDFLNYGVHYEFWEDELTADEIRPDLKEHEYDYYPRGRVVFNKALHKYILYMDPILQTKERIQKIAEEFGLQNGSFYIDVEDEHYQHIQPDQHVR